MVKVVLKGLMIGKQRDGWCGERLPIMMEAVQAEGSPRAGQNPDRQGEVGEQARHPRGGLDRDFSLGADLLPLHVPTSFTPLPASRCPFKDKPVRVGGGQQGGAKGEERERISGTCWR